jgi:hypothetical protein
MAGAQRPRGTAELPAVQARYRRLTPDQRANHVEALMLLGQLVVTLPTLHFVQRSFYVMTVSRV